MIPAYINFLVQPQITPASVSLDASVGLIYVHITPISLSFAPPSAFFLGYSNIHNGFKCLNISKCRIYISQDVIFDESTFPFASLNSNAGTHYTSEALLIPEVKRLLMRLIFLLHLLCVCLTYLCRMSRLNSCCSPYQEIHLQPLHVRHMALRTHYPMNPVPRLRLHATWWHLLHLTPLVWLGFPRCRP
jgi:hypothetical protein